MELPMIIPNLRRILQKRLRNSVTELLNIQRQIKSIMDGIKAVQMNIVAVKSNIEDRKKQIFDLMAEGKGPKSISKLFMQCIFLQNNGEDSRRMIYAMEAKLEVLIMNKNVLQMNMRRVIRRIVYHHRRANLLSKMMLQ